jgi:hypothetical protein
MSKDSKPSQQQGGKKTYGETSTPHTPRVPIKVPKPSKGK